MNLQQLIESLGFLVITKENDSSIVYAVNIKNKHFSIINLWAKELNNLPLGGSNSYLGNYFSIDKSSIWKKYRLRLSDFEELKPDDLILRIKLLKDIIDDNQKQS